MNDPSSDPTTPPPASFIDSHRQASASHRSVSSTPDPYLQAAAGNLDPAYTHSVVCIEPSPHTCAAARACRPPNWIAFCGAGVKSIPRAGSKEAPLPGFCAEELRRTLQSMCMSDSKRRLRDPRGGTGSRFLGEGKDWSRRQWGNCAREIEFCSDWWTDGLGNCLQLLKKMVRV